ncbi:MAG: RluA family pseudouridine synthase, partial [Candidatus Izemoplasmatales bacterium]|nr:RluA family pseudouridine synthase [Candidatus Izemoplasmatales bacterium]
VGDVIEFEDLPITLQDVLPENLDLDIVYEDDDVLVVDKPSGMVVHPAPGHRSGTLVNALLYHVNLLSDIGGELRPGIVHRIDKDTSGLLMVAKNDVAHRKLAKELKDKKTERTYLAIVSGVIKNPDGIIDAPIGRSITDRKKQAVKSGGKEAVTRFEVVERFEDATLVKCHLETGRTHQIRVHMAYIKHPLLGDGVYGKALKGDDFGQYLHAQTLGFTHPRNGQKMSFFSPLPEAFEKKLSELRNQ